MRSIRRPSKVNAAPARTLDTLLDGRGNSLTFVRLVAAVAVIVSHSFPIVMGVGAKEPLAGISAFNLGQHAVNAFFVISGFTLSNSLSRRQPLPSFLAARILRIFPGLFMLGVMFAFFIGPYLTSLTVEDYFSDAHTFLYPLAILVQFNEAVPPHGLFETVPYPDNVNEPLWTIRYELAAYAGLVIATAIGLFRSAAGLALSCLAILALYGLVTSKPALTGDIQGFYNLSRFAICFMIGVVAYRFRREIRLSALIAFLLLGGTALLAATPLAGVASMITVAYLVFCVGALSFGAVGDWVDRNDMSYGTYLYGWPIQQSLISIWPSLPVLALIAVAAPLAMLAGLLSWSLVEKPALRLKRSRSMDGDASRQASKP